jgi:hypothetical protein
MSGDPTNIDNIPGSPSRPPPLGVACTLVALASVVAGVLCLPWFVESIGKEDCSKASDVLSFDDAEIGDCAEVEGFVIDEQGEYTLIEVETTGPVPVFLDQQETLSEVMRTDYAIRTIVVAAELPEIFDVLKAQKAELFEIAQKISNEESYDEEHALDLVKGVEDELVPLLEGKGPSIVAALTLVSEGEFSGPNPLYDPWAGNIRLPNLGLYGPRINYVDSSKCSEVDDYIEQIEAIRIEMAAAYIDEPPSLSGVGIWPEMPEDKFGKCVLEAMPDHDQTNLWFRIENVRKHLVEEVPERQSIRGEKSEFEESYGSSDPFLDETPYSNDLLGKLLAPLLLLLGFICGFVGIRMNRR